ncbi:MAG: PglZ domain-containing protein [Spirochaetales bacterium]|nr:PglZ domain-containing protein [Spirochaetales bacterium]
MTWQEKILNRLSKDNSRLQIVIDETKILFQAEFLDFLQDKDISYCTVNTVNEFINVEKTHYSLIICPEMEIPVYLKNKYEIVRFTKKMLPLHIEHEVYNAIPVTQLIMLLDYVSESSTPFFIDQVNFEKNISEAAVFAEKRKKEAIENKLELLLDEKISINQIIQYGVIWGDYLFSCYTLDEEPDKKLMAGIDEKVTSFILSGNLKNMYYFPVNLNMSVDKILPSIKSRNPGKAALLCFDGMGAAEWKVLEKYLLEKGFQFSTSYQFALIPTITVISRTAVFSGTYSSGFEKNPDEKKSFENYWPGGKAASVFYVTNKLDNKEQLTGIHYVGMIYSFFDRLAHGLAFPGASGSKRIYFDTINSYLKKAHIEKDISLLQGENFRIFFCSDHGTVLAKGNGKKIDNYLIDKSSRRATIIEKNILEKFIHEQKYDIPFIDNRIAVLAANRELFAPENKIALSHGGITVEELIVPFVEVLD